MDCHLLGVAVWLEKVVWSKVLDETWVESGQKECYFLKIGGTPGIFCLVRESKACLGAPTLGPLLLPFSRNFLTPLVPLLTAIAHSVSS